MRLILSLFILGLSLSGHVFAADHPDAEPEQAEPPAAEAHQGAEPEKRIVELRIFYDHMVKKRYELYAPGEEEQTILNDLRVIVDQVNEYYLEPLIDQGINLEVRVKQVNYLDENNGLATDAEKNQDYVIMPNYFQRFRTHTIDNTPFTENYDFNILLSGYELYDVTNGHASKRSGIGYLGTVCNAQYNVAMMKYAGTGRSVQRLAGHIVKGIARGSPNCPNNREFADGVPSSNSATKFVFSPCMISRLQAKLDDMEAPAKVGERKGFNCMNDTTVAEAQPIDDLKDSGIFNFDNLCTRYSNGKANKIGPCKYFTPYGSHALCQKLYCYDGEYCRVYDTIEGMVCGNNKRCNMGRCVEP